MFVVCGEALMDVFGGADNAHGLMLDARIGGSPLNVAIGLARLAQPVAFFGALSTGFLGQRLMRALRDEGVATEAVARLDAPTTLGLVGLDEAGVPSYSFYGHGCADRLLPLDALATVPAAARAFHFGSYAMVVEPVAATQRALVEREHARSLIAYDPNIRLNVEPDIAALARHAAVDAAAHPPAEGQRGGPGPALPWRRRRQNWRANGLAKA